jgi:hypothetical protein
MSEQQKQWADAAEKIAPPKQGPLSEGETVEPIHDEAKPLLPLGQQKAKPE